VVMNRSFGFLMKPYSVWKIRSLITLEAPRF